MEYYLIIKNIHITTAILSLIGFCVRGYWMISDNVLLNHRIVKVFPHINDTLLLTAAIYLSITSGLYPFSASWLSVKVLLLIGYIVAGSVALKPKGTKGIRIIAFVMALIFIGTIFSFAIFKFPI